MGNKSSRAALFKRVYAPPGFSEGGIITRIINEGAERLGFDDERQLDITREAVELTNQMVDAGLVDPQFKVKLRLPTSGEPSTRRNTGIEGDEEVFNAVNHALFSYHAGKSPLARAGSQAKEIYQGIRLAAAGKDSGSESLDYFNNMFGFDLARQGLSPDEAKSAIIDNIANIDNKGALSRLQAGEPLIAGKDLSRTAEDLRGGGPDVTAFDVLAGVQGFQDGGAALDPSDPLYIQEDYRPEVMSDMVRREVKFDASKYPVEEENSLDNVMQRIKDMGQGFADIPEFVGNYLVRPDERGMPSFVSPYEVGQDMMDIGTGMATGIQEDPTGFMLDMVPGVSNVRSFMDSNALYEQATKLDKSGDQIGAAKARSLASFSMTDVFNPVPGSRTAIKGIIAGKKAQRAPEKLSDNRLDILEETPDSAVEQELFKEKGSFVGANGERQFEIDTSPAQVDMGEVSMMMAYQSTKNLNKVLDFPELFENYPQLAGVKVELGSGNFTAQYLPSENKITLNPFDLDPNNKVGFTSAILHETQHAVQNIEDYLRPELFREKEISFKEYRGLPTEVEARNVQGRFSDSTLRDLPPTSTTDLKPEQFSDVRALRDRVNEQRYNELMGLDEPPANIRNPSPEELMQETMERIRQRSINRENVPRGTSLPESRRVDPFESQADTRYRQNNPKR